MKPRVEPRVVVLALAVAAIAALPAVLKTPRIPGLYQFQISLASDKDEHAQIYFDFGEIH